MTFRKLLFWLHLITGCVAGLVVLLMSVTGVLLTYERQMIARGDRAPYRIRAGERHLPVSQLVEAIEGSGRKLPGNAALTLRSDPREPAEIGLGREGTLYVDPYDGKTLGVGRGETRATFQKIRAWHRWLGIEATGPNRDAAKAVTGASNLGFLFLVVSGAYLWIPRQWSRQHLRPITWFRGGLSGKARDFNWHNVFGLWMFVPLFFVVVCALPISYGWAGDLIYSMTGTAPTPPPKPAGPAATPSTGPQIDALWAKAAAQKQGWLSISGPLRPASEASFTIDHGDGGQPQLRASLVLNSTDASVIRWETFEDGNAGRRLRSWTRFTHTGEAFGIPGQTLAGIASLAGVFLVWTGISLALRRLAGWNRRRSAAQPARY